MHFIPHMLAYVGIFLYFCDRLRIHVRVCPEENIINDNIWYRQYPIRYRV